jgi:alpha-beta hydrolase superfamily lysophospholipase
VIVVVVAALSLAAPAGARGAGNVVELPVSFRVANTNTSKLACPSDGRTYTVYGHITGPQSVLSGPAPRPITVYLTGLETSEWNWRFTAVPGYNWPAELAKLGQASLTIDMLAYGASGHPIGTDACYGSQADVAHQIIDQLRHGLYHVDSGAPIVFDWVALAGHDVGGAMAQIEAYSYDDIDALLVITWSDQGWTPFIIDRSTRAAAFCTQGGEPAYPGGPASYFYMERANEWEPDLFYDADRAVIDASLRLRDRNPCGYESSVLPAIAADQAFLGEIQVPVLLAIGAEDPVWTQDGWALQRTHYTGSGDVTAVSMPGTGHFEMLERTAPQFRAIVARWLIRREPAGG